MHPWRGYRVPYGGHGYWPGVAVPKEQEIEMLKAQSQMLAQQLADIQRRIEDLQRKEE